ncbi:MAG: hypothetical protein HFI76_07920 [Lachnospiraceae bacterium]|nr:hypothetical protein [Lachnospiraceae bacterium]
MGKKVTVSAELMDDYKRMSIAMPEKKMRVCSGERTMYSIGNDGNLYLLLENRKEHKGWEKINLTKDLDQLCQVSSWEITTFDVQNNARGTVAIFAAKCDGKNRIFYGESNEKGTFIWNLLAYEEQAQTDTEVAALYLPVFETKMSAVCDLKKDERIQRYFLDLQNEGHPWKKQELPADFTITKQSVAGRSGKTKVDGLYTLGSLAGEVQLLYTPFYNRFNREIPPLPIRFLMERPLDAIAVLPREDGKNTDLFACGSGCLYLYPAEAQKDLCKPVLLAESKEFQNVSSFRVYWKEDALVASGIGKGGHLFFCQAPRESWMNPEAWQNVSFIACDILYAECTWDRITGTETAFGVSKDAKYLQILERSEQTGIWSTSNIRIPDLAMPAKKVPSYVTKIQVEEDGGFCPKQAVMIYAERSCNVYINEQYYVLNKTPQTVCCDEAGILRITEEATGLYGTELQIELEDIKQRICPSKEPMQRLFKLDTPEKLKTAQVDGEPLVGKDCTQEQLDAIAQTLDFIGKHEATQKLWEREQISPNIQSMEEKARKSAKLQEKSANNLQIRLSFEGGTLHGVSDETKYRLLSVHDSNICVLDETALDTSGWDVVYITAAEFFEKLYHLGGKIFEVAVSCIREIWQFTVQIGKTIYTFVMDTLEKLGAGILKLLDYIKVGIQKLIQYVTYVFNWDDIKRTAKALESTVSHGFEVFEQEIAQCQGQIHIVTEMITSTLDKWADIEHHDVTKESLAGRFKGNAPLDVKQSYLVDYSRQNLSLSDIKQYSGESFTDTELGLLGKQIQNLFGFMETEGIILNDFMTKVRDELLDAEKLKSMSFGDICKKILVIIADAAVYTLENILDSLLEIVKILAAQVKRMLTMPIHIPVLSDILKDVFGVEEKSILEIGCLILAAAAVPLLKICRQGDLFREEVLAYIENPQGAEMIPMKYAGQSLSLQPSETAYEGLTEMTAAGLPVPKIKRDAYAALHIICGIANTFETFTAFKCQTQMAKVSGEGSEGEAAFSMWDVADAVLSVVDGGCYIAAFLIYQPCELKNTHWIRIFNMCFSVIKYGGLACKLAYKLSAFLMQYLFVKLTEAWKEKLHSFLTSEKLRTIGEICNAAGSAVLILGSVFYMTMGTEEKGPEEKELLYLDCSSLIGDNLRIILDNCIPHVEEPKVKAILIGCRAFFSISYSALQIAEGADSVGMTCNS